MLICNIRWVILVKFIQNFPITLSFWNLWVSVKNARFLSKMKYYIKRKNVRKFILLLKIKWEYLEFINGCDYLHFWITIVDHQSLKIRSWEAYFLCILLAILRKVLHLTRIFFKVFCRILRRRIFNSSRSRKYCKVSRIQRFIAMLRIFSFNLWNSKRVL